MQSRGRYFEDFKVGEVLVTGRRTVEGGDVSRFAGSPATSTRSTPTRSSRSRRRSARASLTVS